MYNGSTYIYQSSKVYKLLGTQTHQIPGITSVYISNNGAEFGYDYQTMKVYKFIYN
ncbi:MAG: hypothetical protein PHD20_03485 [Clostridia bacterium]|nr:hypothetical protein [Clostridia bacterium]